MPLHVIHMQGSARHVVDVGQPWYAVYGSADGAVWYVVTGPRDALRPPTVAGVRYLGDPNDLVRLVAEGPPRLPQKAVGELLHVDQRSVSRYLRNLSRPTLSESAWRTLITEAGAYV